MTNKPQNINFTFNRGEDLKTEKSSPIPKKSKKDFRKIFSKESEKEQPDDNDKEFGHKQKLGKSDTDYEDVELKLKAYDEKPKTKGAFLFDITSSSAEKTELQTASTDQEPVASIEETEESLTLADMPENIREESLSALFKGYGTKEKLEMIQREVASKQTESIGNVQTGIIHPGEKEIPGQQISEHKMADTPLNDLQKPVAAASPAPSKTDRFPREQTDLAAINPNAPLPGASAAPIQAEQVQQQTPVRAQELQEIVNQIVSKLYTVSSAGKTDTLVQLRHPPLFAGASVVITSFDSAKGEFNIAFENLTQAAKQIMDMQENQNALKFALEQKGYTVHILTATTLSETTQLVEGQSAQNEQRREDEGESSKERQQQEQEEEST